MGEQTQTPHLSLWGVGSLPTLPRAVLDLWSQVPTGFDFLGERLSDRDQDPGKLPVWRGGGGEDEAPQNTEPAHLRLEGCGAPWPREPSHAPAAYRRGTASAPPRSWHSGRDGAEVPAQGPLEASTSSAAGAGSGRDSRGAYSGVREAVTEWAGVAGMPGDPGQTGACRNPVGVRGARAGIGEGRDTNRPCKEARTEMHYGHTEPETPRVT